MTMIPPPGFRKDTVEEVGGPGDWPVLVFSGRKRQEAAMKPFLSSSLAALAGVLMLAGCAVAPVEGPYSYGYGRPYYYDQGPVYYDPWPGYYYGAPTITGRFRLGGGDRDRHWGGGSWRRESLTWPRDRTRRGATAARTTASRSHISHSRARTHNASAARRDSDKS